MYYHRSRDVYKVLFFVNAMLFLLHPIIQIISKNWFGKYELAIPPKEKFVHFSAFFAPYSHQFSAVMLLKKIGRNCIYIRV